MSETPRSGPAGRQFRPDPKVRLYSHSEVLFLPWTYLYCTITYPIEIVHRGRWKATQGPMTSSQADSLSGHAIGQAVPGTFQSLSVKAVKLYTTLWTTIELVVQYQYISIWVLYWKNSTILDFEWAHLYIKLAYMTHSHDVTDSHSDFEYADCYMDQGFSYTPVRDLDFRPVLVVQYSLFLLVFVYALFISRFSAVSPGSRLMSAVKYQPALLKGVNLHLIVLSRPPPSQSVCVNSLMLPSVFSSPSRVASILRPL